MPAPRADRQRRYACSCTECNNDPQRKQRKETIKAHLERDLRNARPLPGPHPDINAQEDERDEEPEDEGEVRGASSRMRGKRGAGGCSVEGNAGIVDPQAPEMRQERPPSPVFSLSGNNELGSPDGSDYDYLDGLELDPIDIFDDFDNFDRWGNTGAGRAMWLGNEPSEDEDRSEDGDAHGHRHQDIDKGSYEDQEAQDMEGDHEDKDLDAGEGDLEGEGEEEADTEMDKDLIDIEDDDPLCAHLDRLFVDHDEPRYEAGRRPPAFSEHPLIRRAYVQAFVASTLHGATTAGVQHMLKSARAQLAACSRYTGGSGIPGLEDMAVTLRTVERRLGLDPDELITYFFVCDKCWDIHTPSELDELDDGWCVCDDCEGRLYTVKSYSDGSRRRVPVKVLPSVSPQDWIRRLVRRPGKLQELNQWRQGPSDEPGNKAPLSFDEWAGSLDDQYRMYDITDGWGWRSVQAGLERRRGGQYEVEDVDVNELDQRFVALPNGLLIQMNLDWFRAMKRSNYSVGAIYLTVCNNPRSKRYLREETCLLAIIPGPGEPSLECLNNILALIIPDFQELYHGVKMQVSDDQEADVNALLYINTSDLPASRKAAGLRSHSHHEFMCTVCKQPMHSLTDPKCFDADNVKLRNEQRFLKWAFRAKNADASERAEIADTHGARWSALNNLPEWWPSSCSPNDPMHGLYLGETKHVSQGLMSAGGLWVPQSRKDKPLEKLERWMEGIWWPSTAGRVPKNILVSGAGKADQWRNLGAVLIPALYECWQINGHIPDKEAPRLNPKQKAGIKAKRITNLVNERRAAHMSGSNPDVKVKPQDVKAEPKDAKAATEYVDQTSMKRNYREHFETICEWQSAIRIWSSQSITVAEARCAQDCHNRACQAWARMGAHLTPYFHLISHQKVWILRYGPIYAQWGYPFEQKNGWLSKLRHNGHQGGELESTMLRGWIKLDLVYELISWLEGLSAAEKTPEDEDCIRDLRQCLRGDKKTATSRGTLLTTIAAMSAHESGELIVYPQHGQPQSLRGAGLYHVVYAYLAERWKDEVKLVMDTSFTEDGSPFVGLRVPFYSHIIIAGLRYGASTRSRGIGNRYAYMNGREAVQIDHILRINYFTNEGRELTADLAIVRPFIPSPAAPHVAWASRAVDIGTQVWVPDKLGSPEVIDVRQFSGHFALQYVTYPGRPGKRIWTTMSLCHDDQEPDHRVDDTAEPDDA